MRFVLRILGTWLLGAALILIIIDGTKSLSSGSFVFTSLGDAWRMLHAQSLDQVGQWAGTGPAAAVWSFVLTTLLAWPGVLVTGIPGIILALAGRSRSVRISNIEQV